MKTRLVWWLVLWYNVLLVDLSNRRSWVMLTSSVLISASIVSLPLKEHSDIKNVIPDYFQRNPNNQQQGRYYYNATPIDRPNTPIVDLTNPCNIGLKLRWMASVGSAIYSPPVLFTGGRDGKKQIVLSTFYEYVEILGYDGYKPWGWPLTFEGSSFQGSPILYDIDGDGTNDIGVVDKNANFYWIRVGEFGQYLEDYHTQVPRLKVRRDWATGLDPNFIESNVKLSMFEHKKPIEEDAPSQGKKRARPDDLGISISFKQDSYGEQEKQTIVIPSSASASASAGKRKLLQVSDSRSEIHGDDAHTFDGRTNLDSTNNEGTATDPTTNLLEDHNHDDYVARGESNYLTSSGGGLDTFDDGYRYYMGAVGGVNESDYVFIDPHVLGSPTLTDVNGDGHMEVIVAISYYFDKVEYQNKNVDFDPSLYIAGGIACWDLESENWLWMVHLDLTTDKTKFKALIYGTPTVADLDGDGRYEVLIGTSIGLLYVLDGDTGFIRRYFPLQFHEIQAQIAVADIRGGSDLEIVVADMGGNLVLVNQEGEILWDVQLSGSLPQTPTVGDVDGDGSLDIAVVAVSEKGACHLWIIDGATGKPLNNYPQALPQGGMATSPVILVDLHDYESEIKLSPIRYEDPALPPWTHNSPGHKPAKAPNLDITIGSEEDAPLKRKTEKSSQGNKVKSRGLHALVPSLDGHLYVIEGNMKCAERIDTGEHINTAPLIDDVTGDGFLDIVVGTMNGQIMVMETSIAYHPLNAWSSFPNNRMNGFTHGQVGVSVPEIEKRNLKYAEIKGGQNVSVIFDIWDIRRTVNDERRYDVVLTSGTNRLNPLATKSFTKPGRYSIDIPVSPPLAMTLVISMTTEHGLYYEDTMPLAISTKFWIWIKYLVVTPIVLLCIPLLFFKK